MYLVDYCLTVPAEETYQLVFSPPICVIVIGCNVIKLICTLFTARDDREDVFLTIGDAIASYLTWPIQQQKEAVYCRSPSLIRRILGWRKKPEKKKSPLRMRLTQIDQTVPLEQPPRHSGYML